MTTTTSYSKPNNMLSFYKNSVMQNISFSIISFVIFIMIVILPNYFNVIAGYQDLESGIFSNTTHEGFVVAIFALITIILAFVLNSYMQSRKKVDFYHALPIKRSQLFTANLLTAITLIIVPYVILSLISAIFYKVFFYGSVENSFLAIIIRSILPAVIFFIVVYLFISFISVNVGTIFDMVILSGVIGFIPLTLTIITRGFLSEFFYGYGFKNSLLLLLSPFTFFFEKNVSSDTFILPRCIVVIIYGIFLAVIFYLLGIYFYNKRKSEVAESRQDKGWPQVVSRVFLSFLSASVLFLIFKSYNIFQDLLLTIVFSILAGLVMEMILSRGINSLKSNIKLILLGVCLFTVMIIIFQFDIIGYTKKVPSPDNVKGVEISYSGRFGEYSPDSYYYDYGYNVGGKNSKNLVLTTPESIETVTESHKIITENIPYSSYYYHPTYQQQVQDDNFSFNSINIKYHLKNGTVLERNYSVVYKNATEKLSDLEANDDFITTRLPSFMTNQQPKNDYSMINMLTFTDPSSNDTITIPKNRYEELISAITNDLLDESLDNIKDPEHVYGTIDIMYIGINDNPDQYFIDYDDPYFSHPFQIPVTNSHTRTISLLRSSGLDTNSKKPQIVKIDLYEDFYKSDAIQVLFCNYNTTYDYLYGGKYDYAYNSNSYSTSDKQEIETIYGLSTPQLMNTVEMSENKSLLLAEIYYENGTLEKRFVNKEQIPFKIGFEGNN